MSESTDQYLLAEAAARRDIDRQLDACGWIVQSAAAVNLQAGRGVAVREFILAKEHGPTREDGSLVHPERFSRWFAARVRDAGLPKIRLHDLRHTYATLALEAGVHPKIVQERLGHSSISITLDTYSHAIPAIEAEAAERVAALFLS